MQDFPSNSHRSRARALANESKKIERVTSEDAVLRRKPLGRQFKETFIGGDARSVAKEVVLGVVVPSIRDMIAEAAQAGIERLIYGENRARRYTSMNSAHSSLGNPPRISYHLMNNASQQIPKSQQLMSQSVSRTSRARNRFDDIVIQSRTEANEVIDQLFNLLSQYGVATVADLYELTGIQSSHTDHKWGWTQLRGARAAPLKSGGYLLHLPDPEPLG